MLSSAGNNVVPGQTAPTLDNRFDGFKRFAKHFVIQMLAKMQLLTTMIQNI